MYSVPFVRELELRKTSSSRNHAKVDNGTQNSLPPHQNLSNCSNCLTHASMEDECLKDNDGDDLQVLCEFIY